PQPSAPAVVVARLDEPSRSTRTVSSGATFISRTSNRASSRFSVAPSSVAARSSREGTAGAPGRDPPPAVRGRARRTSSTCTGPFAHTSEHPSNRPSQRSPQTAQVHASAPATIGWLHAAISTPNSAHQPMRDPTPEPAGAGKRGRLQSWAGAFLSGAHSRPAPGPDHESRTKHQGDKRDPHEGQRIRPGKGKLAGTRARRPAGYHDL